ncbi:hypothetical protein Peur_007494 [Populus x canadensis]
MVTGDNPQTTIAIALECGILSSDEDAVEPNIIERRVFCNYSDAEREEIAGKISVIERSSTNDQLFLVQGLKKRGHVVLQLEMEQMMLLCTQGLTVILFV